MRRHDLALVLALLAGILALDVHLKLRVVDGIPPEVSEAYRDESGVPYLYTKDAYYYLRLAFFPLLETRAEDAEPMKVSPYLSRTVASVISAGGVLVLIPLTQTLWNQAEIAAAFEEPSLTAVAPQNPPAAEDKLVIEPARLVTED